MNRTLDIELLRTFQAVARLGQFRAAAEQVHKSPAAVSVHVQRLEAIAGGRLLDRDNQSVTLTPLGERFTQHAAQVLQAHDRALGALFGAEVAGRVRFGVPDEYAAHVIRDILPGFAAAWPNVVLDVTTAPSGTLRDQIARKRLHMAVTARRVVADDHLQQRAVGDDDAQHLAGQQGIPQSTGRASPEPEDVPLLASVQPVWVCGASRLAPLDDPLPLALHAVGCPYGTAMTDSLDQAGRAWRVVLASPSSQAIETCVEVGLGISVVDRSRVTARMRVLTELPAIARHEVVLLRSSGAAQMPAAEMLAGALARHFRI
ncbi:LysR family transcriptional regulator [Alcaligenaceae bacterium B3P038]|nr:LysR family transcriptional regulator [Alcaligenaceae bacterium B3P038]